MSTSPPSTRHVAALAPFELVQYAFTVDSAARVGAFVGAVVGAVDVGADEGEVVGEAVGHANMNALAVAAEVAVAQFTPLKSTVAAVVKFVSKNDFCKIDVTELASLTDAS